jgi:steroid delta-isomerase-like uncharacterized protein
VSSDESKTVVRRWFDAINRHDLGGVGEVVAEDATWDVPIAAEPLRGRAAVQDLVGGFLTAFSDLKLEITEQIAEGDRVVTYVTASGTNDGELLGMPARGNHVTWKVIHTHTVRDGELKEDFVLFDRLALMERLQATPATAGAPSH